MSKRSPTMKDVARFAGVSQTTVSFVINNLSETGIPEETQQRVREAIQKLGYRPNAMARGLRQQRTHTLGFITDEIAITPFAGQTVEGAQDIAWENNKILLLVNTKGNRQIENAAIEMLLERQVEGVIYAAMNHHEVNPPEILREIPTVLLDCYAADRSFPSVVPDEFGGGFGATNYLLQKGHRRIGFINTPDPIPANYGRLQGYQEALARYQLPFDENLVYVGARDNIGGYEGSNYLMSLADPPTAIFCFNDRAAMGAYDALRNRNLRIPEDVAVVGFDNQEIIAANLYPALTTMALPHYQMGVWAVNHLIHLIAQGGSSNPVQHKMACPLVERNSA
ncbi:MAG: LacI family DNA-binding transcriptional regulator [Anaerolineales bacterium]